MIGVPAEVFDAVCLVIGRGHSGRGKDFGNFAIAQSSTVLGTGSLSATSGEGTSWCVAGRVFEREGPGVERQSQVHLARVNAVSPEQIQRLVDFRKVCVCLERDAN